VVISYEGSMGSGKTTAAIAFAIKERDENRKKIISNVHLNTEYTHFSLEYFLEHLIDGEMENCVLILDEMYQIADARSSATKLNKLFTYFAVQTRKRDVDMYVCTHHIDHIDLRLRRAVDIRGACRYYGEDPCRDCKCKACGGTGKVGGMVCEVCGGRRGTGVGKDGLPCQRCLGYGVTGWARVNFLDRRLRRRYTSDDILGGPIHCPKYWPLFDTKERIPVQAKLIAGIDVTEVV
jgi:hypothetical protein